jgi:NitT/TauT family transport system substrate-binding protein
VLRAVRARIHRTISDLKGKRVGINNLGSSGHLLLAIMAAQVGLDPHKDIDWVDSPQGNFMALFADGKVDAFLASPPSLRSCVRAK